MFAFLRGDVAHKGVESISLDVRGVGYEVLVPDSVHRRLAPGQEVTLLTYCHVRPESFQIFGFLHEEEKALFTMLLGVSGIGPKVALAILSTLSVPEFGRAILDSDVGAFTKVGPRCTPSKLPMLTAPRRSESRTGEGRSLSER